MTARPQGLPDGLRAFRHRNFRLFFAGQGLSLVGTWMQAVAQSWLVLTLTGNPFDLGLIAVAQFTPVLVLGLFGGLVADALPKKPTLLWAQIGMMALAFILFGLTATGRIEVWMVFVLALLLGTLNAIEMPVRQSFAIELVGRSDVANAVALSAAMFNAARIVGPAVAGVVIAAFGVELAFLLNGLSFIAVIAALVAMRDSELRPSPILERPHTAREVADSLAEGLAYVRRTPIVLLAVTVVGLVATASMNFNVLVPAFAKDVLDTGPEGYGFLMASTGVGSLIAAVWLAFGRPRPIVIVAGALLIGACVFALGFTTSYPVALVLLFFAGAGGIAMAVSSNMTIQLAAPEGLRGRVISVHTTVFAGSSPIGGLIAGSIASAAGVAVAFIVGGAAALVVGVGAALWLRARVPGGLGATVSRPMPMPSPTAPVVASVRSAQASTLPNTSAAFRPPNPNEVESTRP